MQVHYRLAVTMFAFPMQSAMASSMSATCSRMTVPSPGSSSVRYAVFWASIHPQLNAPRQSRCSPYLTHNSHSLSGTKLEQVTRRPPCNMRWCFLFEGLFKYESALWRVSYWNCMKSSLGSVLTIMTTQLEFEDLLTWKIFLKSCMGSRQC